MKNEKKRKYQKNYHLIIQISLSVYKNTHIKKYFKYLNNVIYVFRKNQKHILSWITFIKYFF